MKPFSEGDYNVPSGNGWINRERKVTLGRGANAKAVAVVIHESWIQSSVVQKQTDCESFLLKGIEDK